MQNSTNGNILLILLFLEYEPVEDGNNCPLSQRRIISQEASKQQTTELEEDLGEQSFE